ncbi:MAG: hypothetical protein JWM11_1226 [Planctomycetaceae bacterium]|nr:hypothetical protein [Planctomycetaceae bacterium]
MQHRLKAYLGEDVAETTETPAISVPLREIAGILAEAVNGRKAWLEDFADDPIQIPADLYDVVLAYRRLKKSA